MSLFPFYVEIENKNILIVGGGKVAFDKYEKLIQFTDKICIVAKKMKTYTELGQGINNQIYEEFKERAKIKAFEIADLEGIDICIAATSEREVNRMISEACKNRNIPVNVVDDKELCSFIFPKIIKKGKLCIALTTNGASPLYAATLGNEIEKMIPGNIEVILDRMEHFRKLLPAIIDDQQSRSKAYKQILLMLMENENITDEELLHVQ